ncbi:MAG TPA: alpha-amylase family glycosyl hydrolase [Bryobacteraceae bacterium]|jgi:glycosidase|nr:alpha-amylase family glycosyl hydrolase [Bryobacteraceae bacterium]
MRKIFLISFLILAFGVASPSQSRLVPAQAARSSPDFMNRAIIYQVWMRSFTPEGTLFATAAHLPYIADLGATIIYLSPLNVHGYPSVFGPSTPYEIKDYDAIDPEYGSEADLKALVVQAHTLGLKVIMDIVYAHSANDNVLLNRPGFYQRTPDGKLIMSRWKTPQPDFKNLQVREYFRNNMLHWVRDVGVDGFRADVAGGVPTDFWNEARDAMDKINPNVIMLAEADVPEHQLKAYDISYNFPYYAALTAVVINGESAERIRQQWEKAKASFPRGSRFLHLNDNHDRNRADVVFGEKATLATTVMNFTLDGIPFLYNGEEVGDTTAPQQQSHVPIRWDLWKPEGQRRTSIAGRQTARLRTYKQIIQMRKDEAALTSGELTWVNNSNADGVVSFVRRKGDEEILVLINLTNRVTKIQVEVSASDYAQARDLLRNRTLPASLSPDKFGYQMGAFDYLVAKRVATKTP